MALLQPDLTERACSGDDEVAERQYEAALDGAIFAASTMRDLYMLRVAILTQDNRDKYG